MSLLDKPRYDPVTGKPMYSPVNLNKPVWPDCCPCPTCDYIVEATALTGCPGGPPPGPPPPHLCWLCGGSFDSVTILWSYAAYPACRGVGVPIPPANSCEYFLSWDEITDIWMLEVVQLMSPYPVCWEGQLSGAAWDCDGANVIPRTGGSCTGPATITLTGSCA